MHRLSQNRREYAYAVRGCNHFMSACAFPLSVVVLVPFPYPGYMRELYALCVLVPLALIASCVGSEPSTTNSVTPQNDAGDGGDRGVDRSVRIDDAGLPDMDANTIPTNMPVLVAKQNYFELAQKVSVQLPAACKAGDHVLAFWSYPGQTVPVPAPWIRKDDVLHGSPPSGNISRLAILEYTVPLSSDGGDAGSTIWEFRSFYESSGNFENRVQVLCYRNVDETNPFTTVDLRLVSGIDIADGGVDGGSGRRTAITPSFKVQAPGALVLAGVASLFGPTQSFDDPKGFSRRVGTSPGVGYTSLLVYETDTLFAPDTSAPSLQLEFPAPPPRTDSPGVYAVFAIAIAPKPL
jgi:hypothetical protein